MRRFRALAALAATFCWPAAPAPAQQILRAEERIRVGTLDGDGALTQIGGVTRHHASGSVYVLQPLDAAVRIIGSDGTELSRFGRRGEGPGEFRLPAYIGAAGDTIWVTEFGQSARVSLFAPDGRFIEVLRFPEVNRNQFTAFAVRRDGDLVGAFRSAEGKRVLGRVTRGGQIVAVLDTLEPPTGGAVRFEWAGSRASVMSPMNAGPLIVASADGERVVFVHRPIASNRNTGEFRVRMFDAAGRRLYDRTLTYRPRPITDIVRERLIDEVQDRVVVLNDAYRSAGARERIAAALSIPAWQPPVRVALLTATGGVWLQRELSDGDAIRWEYLDGDGRMQFTVDLPATLVGFFAAEREICGSTKGALDEPQLVCYALR